LSTHFGIFNVRDTTNLDFYRRDHGKTTKDSTL
jgi:hypothetical protein